ncbi:MAG: MoaD/ThiS family protein [Thermofilum sp.]
MLSVNSGGRIRVVVDIFGREVRELSLAEGATVVDLLNLIGFKASEVVVAVDGEVVAEDEPLRDGSRVKLHSVVSGG